MPARRWRWRELGASTAPHPRLAPTPSLCATQNNRPLAIEFGDKDGEYNALSSSSSWL